MARNAPTFHLPLSIENHLAALSKVYGHEGKRRAQELLVNARVRVHEQWSYDNVDGGSYGHALYLTVPEALYLSIARQKDDIQNQIRADLNRIHNVPNEWIDVVFLEMAIADDRDWRRDSGMLQSPRFTMPSATLQRIWGENGFRVFISHKAETKKDAAELKTQLQLYGASGFVAHEDIHPTKEWQDEIEAALGSMDAFVALLTDKFHDSLWTDQEVGFALGRRVPIIALKLGRDPYGFIGKFQALSCLLNNAPQAIVRLLIEQPGMLDAYIAALPRCNTFVNGNSLADILPAIHTLTADQVSRIMSAVNENSELQGSFGFNGTNPRYHGDGLASHLMRITGKKFRITSTGGILTTP